MRMPIMVGQEASRLKLMLLTDLWQRRMFHVTDCKDDFRLKAGILASTVLSGASWLHYLLAYFPLASRFGV